jgi:hypothetical protein
MNAEARKEQFKAAKTAGDGRARREKITVSIRKVKKEDRLTRRRTMQPDLHHPASSGELGGCSPSSSAGPLNGPFSSSTTTTLDVPTLAAAFLNAPDASSCLSAAKGLRKLLALDDDNVSGGEQSVTAQVCAFVGPISCCSSVVDDGGGAGVGGGSSTVTTMVAGKGAVLERMVDLLYNCDDFPQLQVRKT